MSVLTGNTAWVDAVNGNDSTGVLGDLTLPFLTISAAILAAAAGDVVYVLPGTYNETLTMVSGVSVIGSDPVNCILSRNVSANETTVTMAPSMTFANFTLNLTAGASTIITGLAFTGGSTASATAQNITILGNFSGSTSVVNGILDSGTSVTDPTKHVTLINCVVKTAGFLPVSPAVALAKTGNGNIVCKDCAFDGTSLGTGGYGISIGTLTGGTTYLFGCRVVGDSQGLSITTNQTVSADKATTFSSFSVTSGSLVRDQVAFGGYVGRDNFSAIANPATSNDSTQGYLPGSKWLNTTLKTSWVCMSATAGAASWFQVTPSTVLTGNTTWVDAVNGNDSTASRGKFGAPYLTISAALTASSAGDVIMVLPGTYNEGLTMKTGVSVIGVDQTNCILLRNAGATNYTAVAMASSMVFANFTLNINAATSITATAVSLPNTANSTSQLFRIIVSPTVSANGSVKALDDVGNGVASPTNQWTASQCLFIGAQAGTGTNGIGINKTGGIGTSVYHDCSFDGGSGTGANISAGAASPTMYFKNCRISGTTGLSIVGTSTVNVDRNTSYSTISVANTATLQLDQTIYYPRDNFAASSDPITSDDLTQGYAIGSRWINATDSTVWACLSATAGAATWVQTTPLPTSPTLTGNTTWVDAVNGNDSTGTLGSLSKPFLTISAAIAASSSGDVVLVLPGTYTETLTMKFGVSVVGVNQNSCILSRSVVASETSVMMADNMVFANFTVKVSVGSGGYTVKAILFSGTTNATSQVFQVSVVPAAIGTNDGIQALVDTGTGANASPTQWWTASQCQFAGAQQGTGLGFGVTKTGSGTSVYNGCVFEGNYAGLGSGTGADVETGTVYFEQCRISGITGLSVTNTAVTNVDKVTSYTTVSVASTATLQLDQALSYPRDNSTTSDPTTSNDLTQGYGIGSSWINTSSPKRVWKCVNAAASAAVWRLLNNDANAQRDTFGQHFFGSRLDYPASGAVVASQVQYTRVWLEAGISLNTLQTFIISSATGNINLGLYDQATPASNSGTPRNLLASTGSTALVSGDNGTYKSVAISGAPYTTTTAGYYWIALIGSSSTPRYTVSASFKAGYFDGSNNPAVKFEASSGVTLPSGPSHTFNASAASTLTYAAIVE